MLAQVTIYLAMAPKSDAIYKALGFARDDVQNLVNEPVPLHLRNAPTKLMKELGYNEGYQHAHNFEGALANMDCLPEALRGRQYYIPTNRGIESRISKRLQELRERVRKG